MRPVLSVVMPMRDAGPYLDEAVESILGQTFGDFEFIIGDDGSTDGSLQRARAWARLDRRIRVLESPAPLGPVGAANRVAAAASCPIVARMDADDRAWPERFRRQLDVLRQHQDAALVGCLFDCIDGEGQQVRAANPAALQANRFMPPIAHGSIMYRRDAFARIGGYRPHCAYFEDQDLYYRMEREGRILIIPELLFSYRFSPRSGRLRHPPAHVDRAVSFYHDCRAGRRAARDPFAEHGAPSGGRIAPLAVVSLAALLLWTGLRPRVFGRLLRRGRLGFDRPTAVALVWAAWAAIAPGSLRAAMRLRQRWRNLRAARLDPDRIYEWRRPFVETDGPAPATFPLAGLSARVERQPASAPSA